GGALADPAAARRLCGPSAALQLAAARAAAVRLARADVSGRPVIASSVALHAYVRAELAHLPREQFRVLFLDRKNRLIRDEAMGDGSVDHAPVYPREVARRALELSASALILLHNHPSGDPSPSSADVDMTRQIVAAAGALRIAVHDHLVVARDGVASLRALGLM
ncbi:MAG: DNA repair protein RadC, partial [Caulobacter sp.]|nr:DNA repair protein RadC [Caulobacter sp.]